VYTYFTIASSTIDGPTFTLLKRHAQWGAAAYCPGNNYVVGNKVACPTVCPIISAANTKVVAASYEQGDLKLTYFVAQDDTNREIVVSFRGYVLTYQYLEITIQIYHYPGLLQRCR
jgi:hypothetical protein